MEGSTINSVEMEETLKNITSHLEKTATAKRKSDDGDERAAKKPKETLYSFSTGTATRELVNKIIQWVAAIGAISTLESLIRALNSNHPEDNWPTIEAAAQEDDGSIDPPATITLIGDFISSECKTRGDALREQGLGQEQEDENNSDAIAVQESLRFSLDCIKASTRDAKEAAESGVEKTGAVLSVALDADTLSFVEDMPEQKTLVSWGKNASVYATHKNMKQKVQTWKAISAAKGFLCWNPTPVIMHRKPGSQTTFTCNNHKDSKTKECDGRSSVHIDGMKIMYKYLVEACPHKDSMFSTLAIPYCHDNKRSIDPEGTRTCAGTSNVSIMENTFSTKGRAFIVNIRCNGRNCHKEVKSMPLTADNLFKWCTPIFPIPIPSWIKYDEELKIVSFVKK